MAKKGFLIAMGSFLGEVVAGLQFWDKCCLNVDGVVVEAVV